MTTYKNINGDSGVVSFEMGTDHIIVHFRDDWEYQYTYSSAGSVAIEEMKILADRGYGLNAYINKHVRKLYSTKNLKP